MRPYSSCVAAARRGTAYNGNLFRAVLYFCCVGALATPRAIEIHAHQLTAGSSPGTRSALFRREDTEPAANLDVHEETKLKVAFVTFVTDITTPGWRDALYVLAYGIKRAATRSKHTVDCVALVPEDLSDEHEATLRKAGFTEIIRKPVPVQASEIQSDFAKQNMARVQGLASDHNTFVMAQETIKYWGLALTQYDRALVVDADVMVLDAMDELMERQEDFIGTYDHGLDTDGSTIPPTQGGFLLFRPKASDFDEVKRLTREGDWKDDGWKGSGIGWCYGGVGPDGLLAYYFNKDALDEAKRLTKEKLPEGINVAGMRGSRMLAVDRARYDVVLNDRLRKEVEVPGVDEAQMLADVKSVHFTGDCLKPWTCAETRENDWLCKGLSEKWWALRAGLEAEKGLPPSTRACTHGSYEPLKLEPSAH